MSTKAIECEEDSRACQFFEFETAPYLDTPERCNYKISGVSVGLGYVGSPVEVEMDDGRRYTVDYGDGIGSVDIAFQDVVRRDVSRYPRSIDTSNVACRWGGFEYSNTERPLECKVVDGGILDYYLPSMPADTLSMYINVRYINKPNERSR